MEKTISFNDAINELHDSIINENFTIFFKKKTQFFYLFSNFFFNSSISLSCSSKAFNKCLIRYCNRAF